MYVHPNRLEELAKLFRNSTAISSLCPIWPNSKDAYQNLLGIFAVIEEIFIRSHTQRHRYFAFLAIGWMSGKPIRDLVSERLEYKATPNDEKIVNEEIRELFKEIEEELRYRYVKYTSIYLQVLAVVLREKDEAGKAEKLLPLNMFLEFGASNRVLINLMCLGLSRTSAILLARTVSFGPDTILEQCRHYLATISLERIAIPKICKTEISRMRGKASDSVT